MRRATLVLCTALSACTNTAETGQRELEAEIRSLHQEQDRQSHEIEVLQNRVVMAEDSARLARQALVGIGTHATVRIAPDAAADEPIPTASAGADNATIGPDPEPTSPRPLIQATGREPDTTPVGPPIVVHDDDRIPVVPLPDENPRAAPVQPHPNDDRDAPVSAPASEGPMRATPAFGNPGVSSVRDPQAAPAYENALRLVHDGQCGAAIDAFSQFLVRWPDHPFADNAMYWRGECMLTGGDARRAAREFEGLLARFPVGNKAPDALYKLVVCYRQLGDEARARTFASRLLRDFPRSDVAVRLREGSAH